MTIMSLSSTVMNLDDHLRFSSHQEKYPASTSSSSRQVGKFKTFRQHDIEKGKFRCFKGNVNNGEINPNDLQVRHRQGGAALLGRGATDREVTFVRRASLDLMTCPYPMLSAFTSKC